MAINEIIDYGGRRSEITRRKFSYDFHIPERRSGLDRRSGSDRRSECYSHRGDKERREYISIIT